MRFPTLLAFAFSASLPGLAEALETEIQLEHGNVEVELANGVFIALEPGVDLSISHRDDGWPTDVLVRAGRVQVMTGFGGVTEFAVRVGAAEVTVMQGAGALEARPDGGMVAVALSGGGMRVAGVDGPPLMPGDRMTMGPGGARRDKAPASLLQDLRMQISGGAPPPPPPQPDSERGAPPPEAGPSDDDAGREKMRDAGQKAAAEIKKPDDPKPDDPLPKDTPKIVAEIFAKLPPADKLDIKALPKDLQELIFKLSKDELALLEKLVAKF